VLEIPWPVLWSALAFVGAVCGFVGYAVGTNVGWRRVDRLTDELRRQIERVRREEAERQAARRPWWRR